MSHTPGPWKLHRGFSDWGMFCQHDIYIRDGGDERGLIASIPSLTPYCMGASQKDRDYAARQWKNAKLLVTAEEMYTLLKTLLSVSRDDGIASWSPIWDEVEDLLNRASDKPSE